MKAHLLKVYGLVLVAALAGCQDSSSESPVAPEEQKQQLTVKTSSQGAMSPQVASASAQTATAFQTLFQQGATDADNPMGSQQDAIRQANASLRSAWNADKTDSRAAFGAAITGIALKINQIAGTMQRAQDNLGLGGNTTATGGGFETSMATSAVKGMPALARVVATPSKAPLVHELQDSLEQLLLPTLDESIQLLETSWSDSAFEFHVAIDPIDFPGDTLVIDRSDVGFALSILQALRAQIRWLVSYNVDVDRDGSYAWAESLSNIDDFDNLSPAQTDAVAHLETLISNNSSFLKVRAGKESLLASVPVELRAALSRTREAATIGYTLKVGKSNHLPTIRTTAVRDSFLRVVDSGIALLSGPRDVMIYRRLVCKDTIWGLQKDGMETPYPFESAVFRNTTSILPLFGGSVCESYTEDVYSYGWEMHARSSKIGERVQVIHLDLSKLLALKDLKVFLPQFAWNTTSAWKSEGPISFVNKENRRVTFVAFSKAADSLGFEGVKSSLVWTDPSFGGVFPRFKTSLDVMEYFREAIEEDGNSAILAARGPLVLF